MAAPFCALRPELCELLTETRTALADARKAVETLQAGTIECAESTAGRSAFDRMWDKLVAPVFDFGGRHS